jgi:ribosomal protein S18 acetylase RimI-like enzyme
VTCEVLIRRATREDLAAILDLIRRDSFSYQKEDVDADYGRAFEEIEAHPDNELIVATRDGEVIGTLQLTFIPGLSYGGGWRAQVEAVRVREDLRNLKIGTRLMEWAIARARERNCKLVQLTTNVARVDAQRFYRQLGFQASHVGMKLTI